MWQVCSSVTIKLTVDFLKTSQPDLNISGKNLTSLFNFATSETHSVFKGKFYEKLEEQQWGHLYHQF